MAGDFYARNSWDYVKVKPLIEEFLEEGQYPNVISDTVIYDHIQKSSIARFGANRLFHCISRVLKEIGYRRRSRRGRTWDLEGDLNTVSRISSPASRLKVKRREPLSRHRARTLGMRSSSSSFYPHLNEGRVEKIFTRGLAASLITPQEAEALREYLAEYQATRHIKIHRVIKTTSDLIQWRRFLKVPYHEAKIKDVHSAISGMMAGTSLKGTPFKANTKHDYVKALRAYLLWMIETGNSGLDVKRVRKIKIPPRDYITRSPGEILTTEETAQIIEAAGSNRDRALIAVLYETGMRIGEVALLRWQDFSPDETGIGVHIWDEKAQQVRHSRIIDFREHVSSWRKEHPDRNNPDAPVFIDRFRHQPLEYQAMWMIIKKAVGRAGVTKRVHAHLFRSSRVTHLVQHGYSESVIKKMIWGNVNTRVYQTYCILSDQDIDRELNEKAGVVKPRDPETIPTRPRKCPECGMINTPTSEWCGKCMNPLTEEARSHREQLIQEVVRHWDVLPEAYLRMQGSTK